MPRNIKNDSDDNGPDNKGDWKIQTQGLNLWYGEKHALQDISVDMPTNKVTAFIGPSGCGKSTLIRCFNRMNDFVDSCRISGKVLIDGNDIFKKDVDLVKLRRSVGMVFQKPNPFPYSVRSNISLGCRIAGIHDPDVLDHIVERALRRAALYDELKDRLDEPANDLSGGQQQRLCIARALSMEPDILLLDEPCSALDPIATKKIEDLIGKLKENNTIVIVTHNMEQARRVSDRAAFLYLGKMIEAADTRALFESPTEELTKTYLSGKFG
jgi:phosphate transport system ATP-binding protein